MQVLLKRGDELIIVYDPREKVEVGDNLLVREKERGVLVQVIETSLLDLPGILEEVVRSEVTKDIVREIGPKEYGLYASRVKNMKYARAKIRKEVVGDSIIDWTGYSPSRDSTIELCKLNDIMEKIRGKESEFRHRIKVGEGGGKQELTVSAFDLQGLNLIVGKKGMGKSHLAKSLLLGLLQNGARVIVFDINDEYSSLKYKPDGTAKSKYYSQILNLTPGKDLSFTLSYMGQEVFLDLMEAMGVRDASLYELRRIWEEVSKTGLITLQRIRAEISNIGTYSVRGALERRMDSLKQTKLVTDVEREAATLEGSLRKLGRGGALVINLKGKDRVVMRATVQTILSRLQELLESKSLEPIFLFAEEAHLYLRDTDWVDAVTRIRHLGMYQFYMTNTPTSVPEIILRQVDNLASFHLDLTEDIRRVAPASRTDQETVELVTRALPAKAFLIIGSSTGDYPLILKTIPFGAKAAGETMVLFKER